LAHLTPPLPFTWKARTRSAEELALLACQLLHSFSSLLPLTAKLIVGLTQF
jgi:hypothetical protein